VRDPLDNQAASVPDVLLYLAGIAGVAAGITLNFLGMRAVMEIGGSCADGGPYVSAQPCPDGVVVVVLLGGFGGVGSLLLAAWKGLSVGGGAVGVLFLGWPALFGSLGFNFLEYGFDPPGPQPGWEWGSLLCGIVFEALAIGPLLLRARSARSGGDPAAAATRALAVGRHGAGSDAANAADTADAADEPVDALVDGLERLAALQRAGSLTDDEYARAKAELLERTGA
jgi:hypothetical protein